MLGELLVILAAAAPEAEAAIESRARVLQRAGARVLLIEGVDTDSLQDIPGVTHVASGSVPEEKKQGLSEEESLFVDAWTLRQTETKSRKGEGLDWDAKGFDSP